MTYDLFDCVRRHAGTKAAGVLRYMDAVHISDWSDLTRARLNEFSEAAERDVCASTARGYLTQIRAIVTRYRDEDGVNVPISQEAMKALWKRVRPDDTVKIALTRKELDAVEAVRVRTLDTEIARRVFIVGAYTGMRLSDILTVRLSNIKGDALTYVSKKTGTAATVPLRPAVREHIEWLQAREEEARGLSRTTLNRSIKAVAARAGLNDLVTITRGGVTKEGEKWQFVTMHTARVTFCTNMAKLGVSVFDIAKMAGHHGIKQTLKYIVDSEPELTARQLAYFRD